MSKVRHVLGISGGKDSAALAIYMKQTYPELDIEYYTSDTGKELEETYELIENLEKYLGKEIIKLEAIKDSPEGNSFDHFLKLNGGYLPSANARWCTNKLKLDTFENFVGNDLVVSYVGIRGDEEREGYISKKSNIQSIFPFRKNIWSEDVISKFLANKNISQVVEIFNPIESANKDRIIDTLNTEISFNFTQSQKLNQLLNLGIKEFNKAVQLFIQTTEYPLANETYFPLINNEEILVKKDIFELLENSGVGVPNYYKVIEFEVNGKKGTYARSRSGCFFCFYQQKIEWVWLYEQHPELYAQAMEYEKEGYTWMQNESLSELIKPERIISIKEEIIRRQNKYIAPKSHNLIDILSTEDEEVGCASCFI